MLEQWCTRLLGETPSLVREARCEQMRSMGMRDNGKCAILGVAVAVGAQEAHERQFLQSLAPRF